MAGKAKIKGVNIKRTPAGVEIEKNGSSITIGNTASVLISRAITGKDLKVLKGLTDLLLVNSAELSFSQKLKKLRRKRLVFISDIPGFTPKIKKIANQLGLKKISYFNYRQPDLFKNKPDAFIAIHKQPRKEFFLKLNAYCLKEKIKFVKVMLASNRLIFVPFILPGESPCYNCYIISKSHNFIYDQDTLDKKDFLVLDSSKLPDLHLEFCAYFLFLKLINFLTGDIYLQEDIAEYILDIKKLEVSKAQLFKIPFCGYCSQK